VWTRNEHHVDTRSVRGQRLHPGARCADPGPHAVDGWWRGTYQELAEETGLSPDQVRRALGKLKDDGFLAAEARREGGNWDRTMSYQVVMSTSSQVANPPDGLADPPLEDVIVDAPVSVSSQVANPPDVPMRRKEPPLPPLSPLNWQPGEAARKWIEKNTPRVTLSHVAANFAAWCAEHDRSPTDSGVIKSAQREQERLDREQPLEPARPNGWQFGMN